MMYRFNNKTPGEQFRKTISLYINITIVLILVLASTGYCKNDSHIYLEILEGKMVFDLERVEIPKIYVLSYELELRNVDLIKQNILEEYYSDLTYDKEFVVNEKNNKITYTCKNFGKLSFNEDRNSISLILRDNMLFEEKNNLDLRQLTRSELEQYVNQAKKFIDKYGGGYRGDLKFQPIWAPQVMNFAQYVDGIQIEDCDISIGFYNKEIWYYGRFVYDFKKEIQISPSDIFTPAMAIEKSVEALHYYYPNLNDVIVFTNLELVYYFIENNVYIPAWVFKNKHENKSLMINALNGDVITGGYSMKKDNLYKKYYGE